MHRFKNILAVYDDNIGSDDVLSHAATLAQANNAKLTLIDISPEKYSSRAQLLERKKRLDRLVPTLGIREIANIDVVTLAGTPFLEIIRQVIRARHDLVIAGTESDGRLRNYFLGSTATHLMRKCPCPVWIVKPGQSFDYRRILACIDPRDVDESKRELDRKILDLGTSLALKNDAELHVVHVWDVEGNDAETIRSEVPDATRKQIIDAHESRHRALVNSLLEKYEGDGPDIHTQLPRGREPHWKILDLVDTFEVDLIVMGTVCRTGISGFLIGNAAESILSQVNCGVFTVKPEGFVSPVIVETPRRMIAA